MKQLLILILFIFNAKTQAMQKADYVIVEKSQSILLLMSHGNIIATYSVVFGGQPKGHKQQEGDEKTPEGIYRLDYKKSDSAFYKAIHVSYPNSQDIQNAKNKGVDPGGLIMIHGQKNGLGWLSFFTQLFNWTNGCIAVSNSEMDELWLSIEAGIPIEIRP